ncbi:MAG: 4-hydroxy-tetrahydrodipicolinate synthase [Thermoleophilia bacterium]|nr:MAG: 4-hydroxy-tetrahydrodipicolinate synthase [Thermoleophilia bacterium]
MQAPFGRILTAMVTPFAADGSIDLDEAVRLAEHLIEHGSEGLVVHGTTGEASTLTDDEKLALTEAVAGAVGERVPVISGTGSNDTAHSAHLTKQAARFDGVAGFLAVTPYYNKPPIAGIEAHTRAIADAAGDLPIVLYNIPQRVVLHLSPADIDRLAQIDTVIAVKQAVTDLDEARQIVEAGRLALYAGNDDLVLPFALLGGVGGICVASHVAGREMLAMQAAADVGDEEQARAIDADLTPLYEALSVTVNPIPVKTAMELLGFNVGDLRLPLVNATDAERDVVRAGLAARGLIG